ncbi:short-chain dehydrogenase-like protein [Xylona heveae TC161]|uniref:Short-chain dehydrogenase-like protein n=1 Tax=Xylona heveae (strain CBS 132557 / TC161) TaxID=1328760 RepID=A0A165AAI9_XYLHT|nr:short-chain dehydrogenase-like protein [Xylona heveae TC161]KZF20174.1 short-chain dehydrogenase-like protein [Xylona heveae TC161]
MASYLVTGATRGLGLEMVTSLASLPASQVSLVIASGRSKSPAVQKLVESSGGRVVFVTLDVTSESSAKDAAKEVEKVLGGKGLDVLINNAGIMNYSPNGINTMDDLESSFKVNVASAHIATSALLPVLEKGNLKKVVNVSTSLGSIAMSKNYALFPVPAYKVSKAALNMLTVQYAQAYAEKGFTFVTLSPGWCQTDLGSSAADLPSDVGAKAVLDIVYSATPDKNGKFFNIRVPGWEKKEGLNQYDGAELPW